MKEIDLARTTSYTQSQQQQQQADASAAEATVMAVETSEDPRIRMSDVTTYEGFFENLVRLYHQANDDLQQQNDSNGWQQDDTRAVSAEHMIGLVTDEWESAHDDDIQEESDESYYTPSPRRLQADEDEEDDYLDDSDDNEDDNEEAGDHFS